MVIYKTEHFIQISCASNRTHCSAYQSILIRSPNILRQRIYKSYVSYKSAVIYIVLPCTMEISELKSWWKTTKKKKKKVNRPWKSSPISSDHFLFYKIKKKQNYLLFSSLGFFFSLVFFICLSIIHKQASIRKKQLPTTETSRKWD